MTAMKPLFRIAIVGTKGGARRYVSGTADAIEFADRSDALHWNKREAQIIAAAFNAEYARLKMTDKFQIEKSA